MTKEPIIREILEKYYYNDKKPYKKALDLAHQEILKKIPSVDEISDLIIDNLDVRKQRGRAFSKCSRLEK